MDDHFRDGFERLLSDMDAAPSWRQVSARSAAPIPTPIRRWGPLVAAAAFVVTLVAVAAIVLPSGGGPAPVGAGTVDYVKLAWSQDVELRCVDMEIVDNGGFDRATIEIWGPNAEGLVRVDATSPDGTVERLILDPAPSGSFPERVWSNFVILDGGGTVFGMSECREESPAGTSSWGMAGPPIWDFDSPHGAFVDIPTVRGDGTPRDIEKDLARDAVVRQDVWRGIPVTVFQRSASGIAEMGTYANVSEIWLDTETRRYERTMYSSDTEILGSVRTTTEVVERGAVSVDSVSFSVEGLSLTVDMTADAAPTEPDDTVTTTSLVSKDARLTNAALTWINQTGLLQDDSEEWRSRLPLICEVGYGLGQSSTPMVDLAEQFIAEDADLSVRSDGSLPSPEEAAETLWIIVADPRSCPERFKGSPTEIDNVDVAAFETAEDVQEKLIEVRNALASASDTDFLDMVIDRNRSELRSGDRSPSETWRRQAIIDETQLYRDRSLAAIPAAEELVARLLARYRELVDDTQSAPPVITLSGANTIYSKSGTVGLQGWIDQPVMITIDDAEIPVYTGPSGRSNFVEESSYEPGTHTVTITATNDSGVSSTEKITVVVDPNLEVQFLYITDIREESPGSWVLDADYAEFLTGEEARLAATEDGELGEGEAWHGGFYIRNENSDVRTLDVDPSAIVVLQACWPDDGWCLIEEAVDIDMLTSLLDDPALALDQYGWSWYGTPDSPFWLTIDNGTIIQIVEQYLP